jgi:hypothetical protein
MNCPRFGEMQSMFKDKGGQSIKSKPTIEVKTITILVSIFFIHIFIHKYHSSMDMWQNIPPRQQRFYPLCQKIFSLYFVHMDKIFQKIFVLIHVLMLAYSCLCSQARELTSLMSMLPLEVRQVKNKCIKTKSQGRTNL